MAPPDRDDSEELTESADSSDEGVLCSEIKVAVAPLKLLLLLDVFVLSCKDVPLLLLLLLLLLWRSAGFWWAPWRLFRTSTGGC